MDWLRTEIDAARESSLLREPSEIEWTSATHARIHGRDCVVFCGNDYLGLRMDPAVVQAAADAARAYGAGSGASRLVSGSLPVHRMLEIAAAEWVGMPDSLSFSTGFAANAGVLPALAGPGDVLFSDALNHASLIDGCRLSHARTIVFPHGDLPLLEAAIRAARPFRRGMIVTESVFSMDGDHAPLAALRDVADREGLGLYVDEAHALGLEGPQGAGLLAALGLRADVVVGTLGKAVGAAGAFVAGDANLRIFLWNHARSFVFSTAPSPAAAGAARTGIRRVQECDGLRQRLHELARTFRQRLDEVGLQTHGAPSVPIVPVVLGPADRAVRWGHALWEQGWFVHPIRPPTVPRGTSRLRITLSAAHTDRDVDGLVAALVRLHESDPVTR